MSSPHHDGLNVEISAELRELLARALARAAELADGARPPAAFVLVRGRDEESQTRLPREPAARLAELDALLAELGDAVEAYAALWHDTLDGAEVLFVEAEERELGCALRLARPWPGGDAAEPRLVERTANRLVAARPEDEGLLDDPVVLLLEVLLCVVRADGRVTEAEVATLEDFAATVPALARHELPALLDAARQQLELGGGVAAVMRHLERLPDTVSRRRCYVLASETARVAGRSRAEAHVLEALAAALRLDEPFCDRVERVMAAKYERARPLDARALATTLMAVIVADGAFDRAEMAAVQALARALPELERDSVMQHLAHAQRTLQQAPGGASATADLVAATCPELEPDGARTLVTLAIELALASEGLDPREGQLIDALATRLGVTEDDGAAARETFVIKYAGA